MVWCDMTWSDMVCDLLCVMTWYDTAAPGIDGAISRMIFLLFVLIVMGMDGGEICKGDGRL